MKRRMVETAAASVPDEWMSTGESTSFLLAVARGRHFAIPVVCVEEVVEMVAPLPLNESAPGVVGLIDYHGSLLALFDLGELAGIGRVSISADNIIVVCTVENKRFSLMVDDVTDVVTVDAAHIRVADEVLSGLMREIAVIQTENETATVVDLWSAMLALPLGIDSDTAMLVQHDES